MAMPAQLNAAHLCSSVSSSSGPRLITAPGLRPTQNLMAAGVILLGQVEARTVTIRISCRVRERCGLCRTDRLLREHGPLMPMPDLLRLLAAGCPRLDSDQITDRCDVHSPDLSRVFVGASELPPGE
jgi:hypothetical protein